MSADEIQRVIRRSVIDRAFAKALRDNFHEAVKEYDLTTVEKAALKAMQIEFDSRRRKPRNHRRGAHHPHSKSQDFYQLD